MVKIPTVSLLTLLAPLFAMASPSQAVETKWQETLGGKVRLISGGQQDGRYKAGLEIVLDEGWKTYWKIPGDSGVPPMLDTSGSANASDIDSLWPVPSRIKVGMSEILGYKDAIIFPLLVTPADKDKPTRLTINVQLGFCSDLCVPMAADLSLDIPAGGSRAMGMEMLIDRDMALVPAKPSDSFQITDITHDKGQNGQPDRLLITTKIPDGYGHKDLFVEGPEDWLLPLTVKQQERSEASEAAKIQHFVLMLDGLPKDEQSKGTDLRFTLTNGEEAVEQIITLQK
nr:protein-disulfide reductase DsbD domain-containing protein [uncultured Cohaesibacter sp.]